MPRSPRPRTAAGDQRISGGTSTSALAINASATRRFGACSLCSTAEMCRRAVTDEILRSRAISAVDSPSPSRVDHLKLPGGEHDRHVRAGEAQHATAATTAVNLDQSGH